MAIPGMATQTGTELPAPAPTTPNPTAAQNLVGGVPAPVQTSQDFLKQMFGNIQAGKQPFQSPMAAAHPNPGGQQLPVVNPAHPATPTPQQPGDVAHPLGGPAPTTPPAPAPAPNPTPAANPLPGQGPGPTMPPLPQQGQPLVPGAPPAQDIQSILRGLVGGGQGPGATFGGAPPVSTMPGQAPMPRPLPPVPAGGNQIEQSAFNNMIQQYLGQHPVFQHYQDQYRLGLLQNLFKAMGG